MAIYKFSNAGGFANYTRYNDFLAGNPAVILDKGSMYPLGVFTLSAAQATIEFTNIPQTYTHLQLRAIVRSDATGGDNASLIVLKPNNSSGDYRSHGIVGIGSGTPASSSTLVDGSFTYYTLPNNSVTASIYGANIIDILDYRNTNKNKTIRLLGGFDTNGGGQITFQSLLWVSTDAITSINLTLNPGNFMANTSFALYGVQA